MPITDRGVLPLPPSADPVASVSGPPPIPASALGAGPQRRFHFRTRYVVLLLILALPLFCAIGVAGYFHLSSETRALRSSLMESIPGQWNKRIAVHVGGFTLGLVRFGSQFFKIPPEPKAALSALHGAEVGIYKLQEAPASVDYGAAFVAADKSMKRRGWERLVGVAHGQQFVAVYIPHNLRSAKRMACCVVVLDHRDLVVASARGNLEPLLDLASKQLERTGALAALLPEAEEPVARAN